MIAHFLAKGFRTYILSLILITLAFLANAIPLQWLVFGLVEVGLIAFLTIRLHSNRGIKEEKHLFFIAFLFRLLWVLFSYYFYQANTGTYFEFAAGDSAGYHNEAVWMNKVHDYASFSDYFEYKKGNISDIGYPLFLGTVYYFLEENILLIRLLNCIIGAYTVISVYRLSLRNFGERVARWSAVLAMVFPNLILYTGLHLKEVEMLLIAILCLDRMDMVLRSKKIVWSNIFFIGLLIGVSFLFRTVLGISLIFALVAAVILSEKRVIRSNQRLSLLIGIFLGGALLVGGKLSSDVEEIYEARKDNQSVRLRVRARSNQFSTLASKAIFAPLIVTIPFATMVDVSGQENQMLINGGNFIKNFLSFFVLLAIYNLIVGKTWRRHVLLLAYFLSYLGILAQSAFAQSERFHQPILPVFIIFAVFGMEQMKAGQYKYFKYFNLTLVIALVLWSWFKLKGRGLM